jgi:hypothetical protein
MNAAEGNIAAPAMGAPMNAAPAGGDDMQSRLDALKGL